MVLWQNKRDNFLILPAFLVVSEAGMTWIFILSFLSGHYTLNVLKKPPLHSAHTLKLIHKVSNFLNI